MHDDGIAARCLIVLPGVVGKFTAQLPGTGRVLVANSSGYRHRIRLFAIPWTKVTRGRERETLAKPDGRIFLGLSSFHFSPPPPSVENRRVGLVACPIIQAMPL